MAYTIFNRFLKRVDERVKLVDELLGMEHDFTVDEEMVTDSNGRGLCQKRRRSFATSGGSESSSTCSCRKPDKTEGEEAVAKLRRRYPRFAKRMHQIDNDELLEMFLTAITSSFDPHTTYMSPSSYENFLIQMRLELEGIGAALQFEDGYTKVSRTDSRRRGRKRRPAEAGGPSGRRRPRRRRASSSTSSDMNLNDVVKLIRGTPGTIVRLKVMPAGGRSRRSTTSRGPASSSRTAKPARRSLNRARNQGRDKPNGQPYKIGVIDLPSFYMDMEGVAERVERLQEHHARRASDPAATSRPRSRRGDARSAQQRRRQSDRGRSA